MLEGRVRRQDGVVRLDDGGGDLRSRVHSEFQLGFLPVIDGQPLHEEGCEAGTSAAAEGMEDEKTLKPGALVGELADAIGDDVDDLLADRVVPASVVVCSVFLAGDQLFWVEQLSEKEEIRRF